MSAPFDLDIRELSHHGSIIDPDSRLIRVRAAYAEGIELPPILVVRLFRRWELVDGTHRLTVAREFGCSTIRAKEFR